MSTICFSLVNYLLLLLLSLLLLLLLLLLIFNKYKHGMDSSGS